MVKEALLQNTLIVLPTGLGKTFIAAVVMYNYYRWFPRGKVLFTAPTKPLVDQQVQAIHTIMHIPQTDIAVLNGSVGKSKRRDLWKTKRVFFCTPQILQNDFASGLVGAEDFVCVVLDEAHR
jgi:ERCC4-related helicase